MIISFISLVPNSTTMLYYIKFIVFQGAGHNDVELHAVYLERLKQFVTTELLN